MGTVLCIDVREVVVVVVPEVAGSAEVSGAGAPEVEAVKAKDVDRVMVLVIVASNAVVIDTDLNTLSQTA